MRLFPNLNSPAAVAAGTMRCGAGSWPSLAYVLNHGQYLCVSFAALSFLSPEGAGYAQWVTIFNNRYVAVALLNQLGDFTSTFTFASFLLGLLSTALFVRRPYLKIALMLLPILLSTLTPSYGMA